jgi:hypothetical protein
MLNTMLNILNALVHLVQSGQNHGKFQNIAVHGMNVPADDGLL